MSQNDTIAGLVGNIFNSADYSREKEMNKLWYDNPQGGGFLLTKVERYYVRLIVKFFSECVYGCLCPGAYIRMVFQCPGNSGDTNKNSIKAI